MIKHPDPPIALRWRRRPLILRASARSTRWLRVALLLALIVGAFHFNNRFHVYRHALLVKYLPTDFPRLTTDEQAALASPRWQWADYDSLDGRSVDEPYSRRKVLSYKHEWSRLGGGWEGDTYKYGDNVIKVYKQHTAPFRNCIPGWVPELRWPTEISASVVLGGVSGGEVDTADAAFVPVTDYFLSPPIGETPPQWHFVTPLLRNGDAEGLSERLRADENAYTARELDTVFRPSMESILLALDRMHSSYDLCHDDLKIDNIFLGSKTALADEKLNPNETTHWMLGDLGNARHIAHPYHSSVLWLRLRHNVQDCRANDVFRLLKVYMEFLRRAVADTDKFDREFFEGSEPWSRLFWSVSDEIRSGAPPTASTTRHRSVAELAPQSEAVQTVDRRPAGLSTLMTRLIWGDRLLLSKATREAIKVSASEKVARIWGLVPLLGVPKQSCAAGTA